MPVLMSKFRPEKEYLSAYEIWKIAKKKKLSKEEYRQLLIDNKILIPKKKKIKPSSIITSVIKRCPNCKEPWNGYECPHCGFDATESDIY